MKASCFTHDSKIRPTTEELLQKRIFDKYKNIKWGNEISRVECRNCKNILFCESLFIYVYLFYFFILFLCVYLFLLDFHVYLICLSLFSYLFYFIIFVFIVFVTYIYIYIKILFIYIIGRRIIYWV
jgi:hypothetical protein